MLSVSQQIFNTIELNKTHNLKLNKNFTILLKKEKRLTKNRFLLIYHKFTFFIILVDDFGHLYKCFAVLYQ